MKVIKRSGKGCVDIDGGDNSNFGRVVYSFNLCYGLNKIDNGRLIVFLYRLIVFACILYFGILFYIDLYIFRL